MNDMDDLELILAMLGERTTMEISQKEEPETFSENKKVARRGGRVAGGRQRTDKEGIEEKRCPGSEFPPSPEKGRHLTVGI